ncbi:MAG: hypothetical protein AAGB13_08475 [Cyanobacteria bacterium P01_F01_bin.33]
MLETPTIWVSVESNETTEESPTRDGSRSSADTGASWDSVTNLPASIQRFTNRKRIPLDAKLLKEQMTGLLAVVGDLFEQAAQQSTMQLEELQLSVEIDGEGQVNLVGNGAKLGNSGGITMTFKAK